MKILLAANAQPDVGGQGLNLAQFVQALAPRFEITLFARDGMAGVEGITVSESPFAKLLDRIPLARGLDSYRQHLSNVHFDGFVAAHLPPSDFFQGVTGQCLQSLRRASAMGAITILDCITTHVDDYFERQRQESIELGLRPMISEAAREMALAEYALADRIRVMSEHARRTMLERGIPEERIFVAPPPLEIRGFPLAQFGGSRFRVSYVGLLNPAKGFRYLMNAFRGFPEPSAELVLWTAPGNRKINCYMQRQMAADRRIQMRPVCVRENYAEVYGTSHVLVHPSLADGYSYAVMEAMASGLPVIVTSCTGSAELIQDGVNGFVVPPYDADAIRDRLVHLSTHPDLLRRMGAAARETIRTQTSRSFSEAYCSRLCSFSATKGAACST